MSERESSSGRHPVPGLLGRRVPALLPRFLAAAASADDLAVLLHKAYPDDGGRTITNWSYQLWQFIGIMAVGALAVMPLKNKPYVAIG